MEQNWVKKWSLTYIVNWFPTKIIDIFNEKNGHEHAKKSDLWSNTSTTKTKINSKSMRSKYKIKMIKYPEINIEKMYNVFRKGLLNRTWKGNIFLKIIHLASLKLKISAIKKSL